MEKSLKIDCNYLKEVLLAILPDEPSEKEMNDMCDECPYLVKGKCAGKPPLTLEDIYEPDEEMR